MKWMRRDLFAFHDCEDIYFQDGQRLPYDRPDACPGHYQLRYIEFIPH